MKKLRTHFLGTRYTLPENYVCVGIVTPIQGHRMAWTVNHLLDIQLSKAPPKAFGKHNGEDYVLYTHYSYENAQEVYRLIRNRLEGEDHSAYTLIQAWKAFDYLLLCQIPSEEEEKMLKELRNCSLLQYVSLLEIENKYAEKLMF